MTSTPAPDKRRACVLCARTILVCLLPSTIAGCGGSGGVRSPFEAGAQRVRIDVLNRNFADATLRAVVDGAHRRLGTVRGHSSATFRLDWPYSRPLRIEIDLLAGGSCITPVVDVDPGEVIDLRIEPNLRSDGDCRLLRGS